MKYLRSTALGSKDIEIRKSEFVAKTQLLILQFISTYQIVLMLKNYNWNVSKSENVFAFKLCICFRNVKCSKIYYLIIKHLYYFNFQPHQTLNKSEFNLKSDRVNLVAPAALVLLSVCFSYTMSRCYSTNWDRKGLPGSEI